MKKRKGMRGICKRFHEIKDQDQGISTYVCLGRTIIGKKLNTRTIRKHFFWLVDRDEYRLEEIPALLRHLRWLSKQDIDDTLEGVNCPITNENVPTHINNH